MLFDDPDWHAEWDLTEARRLADKGLLVVVTSPRERVLEGPTYRTTLHPVAGLADVVIEMRHTDLATAGVNATDPHPGVAVLVVLRNRRGPEVLATSLFQPHFARFVDHTPLERP